MSGAPSVTIAVDAMGGDRAPDEIVAGARAAARPGLRVLLCGPAERLQALVGDADGLEIVEAPDTIGFGDDPAASVRARPRSSLVTACRLVREGEAQAALSAGSTGAMLAASAIVVGRVRGVSRPGIAAVLPGRAGPCVLIDAGANAEARPENLLQFGVMGAVFAEDVLALPNPRVALVSNGEEPSKGTALVREAHALLAGADLQFIGNCEGRDALTGEVQVLVADGF